jgi:hypothetical protein
MLNRSAMSTTEPNPLFCSPDDSGGPRAIPPSQGPGAESVGSAPGPTPSLIGTSELARRLNVTPQTISNWRRLSLQPAKLDLATGYAWWDEQAVRRWRAAYRPSTGQGGRRPGGGRKRADPLAAMRKASAENGAGEGPAAGVRDLTKADLQRFLADPASMPMHLLHGRGIKEQFQAAKAAAEAGKLRGELLPREDVEEAWGQALALISRAIDAMPPRASPGLIQIAAQTYAAVAEEKLTAAEAGRVLAGEFERLLREEIEIIRRAIVSDPLPADTNHPPAATAAA